MTVKEWPMAYIDKEPLSPNDIIEITDLGTWQWFIDTDVIIYNNKYAELLGYTLEEFSPSTYTTWKSLIHSEDLLAAETLLSNYFDGEIPIYDTELRIKHKDGHWIWIHIKGKVVTWSEDGKPLIMYATNEDITLQKQAIKELHDTQLLLKAGIESNKDMIILAIDQDFRYLFFNETHKKVMVYAYNKKVELGMNILDCISDETDRIRSYNNYNKALMGNAHSTIEVYGHVNKSYYETFYNPIYNETKDVIGATAYARNITKQKLAEETLIENEKTFRSLFEKAPIGTAYHQMIYDEAGNPVNYRILEANQSYQRLTGTLDPVGKLVTEVFPGIEKDPFNWIKVFGDVAKNGTEIRIQQQLQYNNRSYDLVAYQNKPDHFVASFFEITVRKQLEAIVRENEDTLEFLSFHDELTGLYNRRFFQEEMKRIDTKRSLPISLIMGDVNGLKLINDSFGHESGDLLLKKTATAMKLVCRAEDIIARIGGDEFVIILPNSNEDKAMEIIDRIKSTIAEQEIKGISISVSFGCGTKTKPSQDLQDIFKDAEDYLYKHKLYESSSMRNKTLKLIYNTLHEKNLRELVHSEKVSELCEILSIKMGFSGDAIKLIKLAGLMHDIGKIGIPDEILNKPGKLSDKEFIEIKKHPEIGYRILSSVNEFSEISDYVLQHHEHWDGKGYPQNIKGETIKIEARIIGLVDAYAAMTNKRTYGEILSSNQAIDEIKRCTGTQFDPKIAKIFIEDVLGGTW